MLYFTKTILLIFFSIIISAASLEAAAVEKPKTLPGESKKVVINKDHYFIYEFAQKPSMGTVVLRVRVYDNSGKQLTPYAVFGDYGMPSMRGHHDSGKQQFKLNKRGDYLLPVNIVMPGDWDVTITIEKDGKAIFKGVLYFDI
jgi:hypothetical protein